MVVGGDFNDPIGGENKEDEDVMSKYVAQDHGRRDGDRLSERMKMK